MKPYTSGDIFAHAKWLTQECQAAGLDAEQYGAEVLVRGAGHHLSERVTCKPDDEGRLGWYWSWGAPIRPLTDPTRQGRDLLEVLATHHRGADVRARLVELDPRNSTVAEEIRRAARLDGVEVVTADAALTDHYIGMVPAHLVLVCGLFGNITDDDIERTIDTCTCLCATGGTVIWTRHRDTPDPVPRICRRFGEHGFDLLWLSDPSTGFGVGAHHFTGVPRPLAPGKRMFSFIGYDALHRPDRDA